MSSISFASPYGGLSSLSKIEDEIKSHNSYSADERKDTPANATSLLIKYEWVQSQITEALQKAAAAYKNMKTLVRTMLTKIKSACLTSNLQRANRSRSGSTRRAHSQSLSKASSSDPDGEAPHPLIANSSLLQLLPIVSNRIQQIVHRHQSRARSIYAVIMHAAYQISPSLKNISQAAPAKKDTSNSERFLKLCEVIARTGLSRSMIYYKLDKTSRYYDPLFPKKNKIGLRSIRFLESELNLWMQAVAAKGENHE